LYLAYEDLGPVTSSIRIQLQIIKPESTMAFERWYVEVLRVSLMGRTYRRHDAEKKRKKYVGERRKKKGDIL
jgi:hypothetical protein